ncbi:MAG: hypothetical protein QXY55_01370 [Candidatus Korarchaeota archaeon]|nr:hypothetical protein [Thermoproteota archaeon]MCR8500732.1 hypothetical protein [Thermoproteota archaeon]
MASLPSKDGRFVIALSRARERASARKGAALSEPAALWERLVEGESLRWGPHCLTPTVKWTRLTYG